MTAESLYIKHTKIWLSTVVIELGLCPFARREYDGDSIAYRVIKTANLHNQLQEIILECADLDADEARETSLLIFPDGLSDFAEYLDLLELANALLAEQGYEGIYQLASFHPAYCFEGVGPDKSGSDDPSHFTNRSPYPTVHILREASVEKALKTYPHPEKIPERNIALTQKMGVEAMRGLLAACYEQAGPKRS